MLVEPLLAQGRDDAARHFAEIGKAAMSSDDVTHQVLARTVDARLAASDGDLAAAEAEAREAVGLASGTDAFVLHADALVLLGEVLAAQRSPEAADVFEQAGALYERKRNIIGARRATAAVATARERAPAG